ncbi:MAG: preprotein translocase subunit SecE [Anaerolineae bacterium]
MAGRSQKNKGRKGENALLRYLRDTRSELRKVRWPTRDELLALTQIVALVTFGMAILLGGLDLFFGWVLSGIITQNFLFVVLGIVILVGIAVAAVLIGEGEGV